MWRSSAGTEAAAGFILRLSRDRHDAEDIMATAFLELWRRRDTVRVVEGPVLPWLLVTTANAARNSGRIQQRAPGGTGLPGPAGRPGPNPGNR
ncbi:sigma factor [Arthrobacter sp. ES3-54]|uniref:RNA polymerase sigma factor n=1 Tax=Arthrobacter sp. ES3-54 TaxID=1502991 RepID=UPI0024052F43|nr:sigma factor [Arthrobacter sp. ES3-54]